MSCDCCVAPCGAMGLSVIFPDHSHFNTICDLDTNCLTLLVLLKEFLVKIVFDKNSTEN